MTQEFITPYPPQQNGLIERFFRSPKEECVWQHRFDGFEEERHKIKGWMGWYNAERPHQALQYGSPHQYRQQQELHVA
ncbi:MAG: transposase [Nitrospiraceae bacterium]|nr:transposase [Nitrospira sp.]MCB9774474.1 transposase [Nitrospiraceae bacterium]